MGLCASKDSRESTHDGGPRVNRPGANDANRRNDVRKGAGEKKQDKKNKKAKGSIVNAASNINNSSSGKTKISTVSEDGTVSNGVGNTAEYDNANNKNNGNNNNSNNNDNNNNNNNNIGNNINGNNNNDSENIHDSNNSNIENKRYFNNINTGVLNGVNGNSTNSDKALSNQFDQSNNSETHSGTMTGISQALALNDSGVNGFDTDLAKRNGTVNASGGQSPGGSETVNALKVLLLGSGESGKSTVLQQLKILHQNGFSREELLEYKPFIFDNIIETGKDLAKARRTFNVQLEEDAEISESDLDELLSQQYQPTKLPCLPADLAKTLKILWNLQSTQDLLVSEHRSSFYLMDSASYFYENLDRISEPKYIPTITDVIRTRKKTSGIFDTMIDLDKNLKLHFFDVGGQRSERKKWIHCFDNVTLIIFCVSLSEYDQTLLEDNSQNRLEESLILFDSVVNSRWFARSSVVLFLNKIDIFAEKLRHVPLEKYFPDYTGGKDINKAAKYILWRFVQLNRANLNIYPHVTQATDTSNIKLVFAAIKETILENSLKDSGVL